MNANPPAALSAKQRRILAAYRQTATVTGAARASSTIRTTAGAAAARPTGEPCVEVRYYDRPAAVDGG